MRRLGIAVIAVSSLLIAGLTTVYAETPLDTAALSGLKEVKIAFDVQTGNSAALLTQLQVIEETRDSLLKQGVKPSIVVGFRGPASKLVQTDISKIPAEDRENAAKIADKIKALQAAEGVAGMEQCAVATRIAGTDPEKVLPGIMVVGNGWISLAAYQAKGYGYIAP
jgi:intracellular sulfur oxidation DsrE/DsrF family protein